MITPDRIARLPRDKRGYPIPWNVLREDDGTPIFTANDTRRSLRAIHEGLCPICGERLGKWKWFVGGPGSAFHPHGWYLDLPQHHECVTFALQTCPYLAMPKYLGRVDLGAHKLPSGTVGVIDETQIPERPDIFVAVASDKVEIAPKPLPLSPYVRPVRPFLAYEFWRHGEQIPVELAMPVLRIIFGAEWELPEVAE